LLVLLCDLLSKYFVSTGLLAGEYLGGILRVTLVSNSGAAFGLFPGARGILIAVKLLALASILILMGRGWKEESAFLTLSLALIFGGALGNLLDRFRASGEVIDFLDVGLGGARWYVFNIADACISVGALLLILSLLRRPALQDGTA
jgi:signal peptidase II